MKLLDSTTTPQNPRLKGRCICMSQSTYYGSYLCKDNGTCYRNNPLHVKWWEKNKTSEGTEDIARYEDKLKW